MTKNSKNKSIELKVMSYNLHYHRAFDELQEIIMHTKPDVLCLQECRHRNLPEAINAEYVLAEKTVSGRLDVAIYYRMSRFMLKNTQTRQLGRSFIEGLLGYSQDRLAISKLVELETGTEVIIGSIHAAPLNASNRLRRFQITEACHAMRKLTLHNEACVLIGDFNYPVFRDSLNRHAQKLDFKIWRADEPTYKKGVVRGNFDLLLTRNTKIGSLQVLESAESDHRPIIADIQLSLHATYA